MLSIDDVLIARDFSSVSDRAVRYALDVAARTGATLHVFYAEVLHEDAGPNGESVPWSVADVSAFRAGLKESTSLPAES